MLKPAAAPAKKARPEELQAAADRRDRIWTLLQRRYDLTWKAGALLFGRRDVDANVPPLQSRVVERKTTAAITEPPTD